MNTQKPFLLAVFLALLAYGVAWQRQRQDSEGWHQQSYSTWANGLFNIRPTAPDNISPPSECVVENFEDAVTHFSKVRYLPGDNAPMCQAIGACLYTAHDAYEAL